MKTFSTTPQLLALALAALAALCASGCDAGTGSTEPSSAGASTPAAASDPQADEADSCGAAAAYLQACGAPGLAVFEASCTEALAEDLLELSCSELPEALESAGYIDIEPTATPGDAMVVGSAGSSWGGSWLACNLGFKFACPSAACQLDWGVEPPSDDEPCIEWLRYEGCGACEYYRCREAQSQCGADGYLLGYVGKYCDRFSTVTEPNTSPEAAQWLQDVRECLITTLDEETGPETSCEDIEAVGIASHATCYVQAGFCDLGFGAWFDIVHTIDPGDIPLQQVLATGHLCLQSWFGN